MIAAAARKFIDNQRKLYPVRVAVEARGPDWALNEWGTL